MPVSIATMLFRRLVTEKSGLDAATVARVLDAEADVLEHLLGTGASVRFCRLGALVRVQTKATRRRLPSGELIEVPVKDRIIFRPVKER